MSVSFEVGVTAEQLAQAGYGNPVGLAQDLHRAFELGRRAQQAGKPCKWPSWCWGMYGDYWEAGWKAAALETPGEERE